VVVAVAPRLHWSLRLHGLTLTVTFMLVSANERMLSLVVMQGDGCPAALAASESDVVAVTATTVGATRDPAAAAAAALWSSNIGSITSTMLYGMLYTHSGGQYD
jgi:hypothetical protein